MLPVTSGSNGSGDHGEVALLMAQLRGESSVYTSDEFLELQDYDYLS